MILVRLVVKGGLASVYGMVWAMGGGDPWYSCILISESSFIFADEMNHFTYFHTMSAPCLKGFKNTKF